METLNENKRRQVIAAFFKANKSLGRAYTVRHFKTMGIQPKTTYRILNRLEATGSTDRQSGSGGSNKIMDGNKLRSLRALSLNRLGVSTRKLARRYNVTKSTVHRHLRAMGAVSRLRVKVPEYTEEQKLRSQERAKKLATVLINKFVIMDDESYFPMKSDVIPGNDRFYCLDYTTAPEDVKYMRKRKFPTRLLVWLAISTKGISTPFFIPAGSALNGEMYREKCIKEHLLPFLQKHHLGDNILFWPDGASAHYAKATLDFFATKNIPFVAKDMNPPNLPQARPIENVWSQLKAEVYRGGWEASSLTSLKRRIKRAIGMLDMNRIISDLEQVPAKLRKIGRFGVYSVMK
jgi:DNA-binding transcriptional ArsR family regulator